ncbi:MAG TPA: rod shape-determining protein MreD [Paludibacteraceae bacterium]|jgi:rod shape-determining protein MreD|nr:rod shape-determining protein MreD [Paludibacteraceae bacterium]HPS10545.1 rod shape-determining protein MreD [Paludibacteraceae bacterium]
MAVALQNILRFIFLILLQVFILDNIQFMGYINPMIYVLFILSLPVRFPKWALLILAFIMGLIIDVFSNTAGMHSFALVFAAFLRTPVINIFTSIDEGSNPTPSFHTFGVSAYVKYVVILVLIHHFILFFIESFSFLHLTLLIPKIIISSTVTILLILGLQSFKSK